MNGLGSNQQFSGWWAVILGGSSGFGLASVEKLAAHGMNVALLYRETAAVEKPLKEKLTVLSAEKNVRILSYNINALIQQGIDEFLASFQNEYGEKKCVRLLLHSIARGNLKPLIGKTEEANMLTTEDIQLTTYAMSTSLLDWTKALLAGDLFCADARVIGLTSEGAHKYWDSYAAVSIAKSSLESLSTYMAVEFAAFGIKTNIIQAGITETPSLNRIPGSRELVEHTLQTPIRSGALHNRADLDIYIILSFVYRRSVLDQWRPDTRRRR